MIPTPKLSHLTSKDYEHVYEPAEDTFILLDALEQDVDIVKACQPLICLEVGSGSGCVSAFVSTLLGKSAMLYLATDINPHAARCTRLTGSENDAALDSIIGPLAEPFSHRLKNQIDILIFNPPYVPTELAEVQDAQGCRDISGSWAGGGDGMEVTNLLLNCLGDLLSLRGILYLVAVKQNKIEEISGRLEKEGFETQIALQRRAGREHLFVLRILRFTNTV